MKHREDVTRLNKIGKMKRDQGNAGTLKIAFAAGTEEFRITLKKNPASSYPPFRYRFPDVRRRKLNCFEFFILDVYYFCW